ncbi:hypothetical protein [Mycobacterium sp.]|uniref:hypothetical protein n=1 Tax=Mycobacterium sp. TaxID=1785 RepID=UPI003BA957C8
MSGTLSAVDNMANRSCGADVFGQAGSKAEQEKGFGKRYELVMDGQPVMRFLIQDAITQAQLERAVRVTEFYLKDVPGSAYGSDKSGVRKQLAANNATMLLLNGADGESSVPRIQGQPLYASEIAAEGSRWYVINDPEHRDAALEEIFHQVHDNGIGTNRPGALPQYQAVLLAGAKKALADGRWAKSAPAWVAELEAEGSLAQEYIASVIDTWYGMWAHSPDGNEIYRFSTREEVRNEDPDGAQLIRDFLPNTLEYEAYIDPSFNGSFTLTKSADTVYSGKSQYLRGARLTGENAAGLIGNDLDNTLRGNQSDNQLDGAGGTDVAIYCHAADLYAVTRDGADVIVTGPDGTDTLSNIERVHFLDGTRNVPTR